MQTTPPRTDSKDSSLNVNVALKHLSQQQPPLEDNGSNAKLSLKKIQKKLRHRTGQAIQDFNMIEDGDHIMVCLSGGKDSYTMLEILLALQSSAPIQFKITAVNLDQKQPGFPEHVLPEYLNGKGIEFHIIEEDTYSIVKNIIPEGKTTCGLCSRLRRGNLYGFAEKHGFNKIALGHHRDDLIETLFLNLFFGGKIQTMPPKLRSDDGKHIIIRPLAYCSEDLIARYALMKNFPIIPCNLCGSQQNLQRQTIKQMLTDWETEFPGRSESILTALQNVSPSHLADHSKFNFKGLKPLLSAASLKLKTVTE